MPEDIWVEPDTEEVAYWVGMAGDDLAETNSPTWKLEMYVAVEGSKD